MSRRHPKKAKAKVVAHRPSAFLDPSMDEIQNYIEAEMLNDEMENGMATHLPDSVKKGSKAWKGSGNTPTVWQGPSYHGNSGYVTTPSCTHTGDVLVFEHEGKELYASSWQGLKEYSDKWNLIIDLAGNVRPKQDTSRFVKPLSTVPKALAEKLESLTLKSAPMAMTAQLLSLDWNDMGVPPVGLDFWHHLWAELPSKTVVACMGGHGRTGTCLCALMIATGLEDYWGAIEHVRKEHCKKAVESLPQEKYLHALYVDKLRYEQALALFEGREADVKDFEADIVAAMADEPSSVNSTGSKVKTGVFPSDDDPANSWGLIIETKLENGVFLDRRCTKGNCAVYSCHDQAHLQWVARGGSLALA